MNILSVSMLVAGVLAFPIAATAQMATAPSTAAFVEKVAGGNTFEIESSRVAMTKSANAEVKAFAQKMVTDHTEAASKFKAAVGAASLKAPPEKVDAKHAAIIERLKGLEGAAFDREYVTAQREAHIETVALFEAYAAKGENEGLRKFANELLPTLRMHLEHVKKLKA